MLRVMMAGVMRPVRFVFFDVRGLGLRHQQRRAKDGRRQNQDEFFHILKTAYFFLMLRLNHWPVCIF
jgi:hypothetical protein